MTHLPFGLKRRIENIAVHAMEKYWNPPANLFLWWLVVDLEHLLTYPASGEPLMESRAALIDALETQLKTTGQLMTFDSFDEIPIADQTDLDLFF